MALTLTTAGKNLALTDGLDGIDAVSLHSADPTAAGNVGELADGDPAYSRLAPSYQTPSNGSMDMAAELTFNVPAGSTVSHAALWVGAVCVATGTVQNSETYTGQGVYRLKTCPVSIP